jgi:sn-glycerol 3-phosphate transport system substrate-binding protein
MDTGYLPIRRSAVDLPVYQNYIKNVNPELIVAIEALRNSKPAYAGSVMGVFTKARVIIENEVETMANNPSVTPQQVVDRIVSQINEEIALYNRTN